jgi:Lrp/AsnC family transcriptional regulator for asnA, asnC and gidA
MPDYQIDSLDRKILAELLEDARKPYLDIARRLKVAHGTVNSRVRKMHQQGLISGTRIEVDHHKLGFQVRAIIGIKVTQAAQHKDVERSLAKFPEVIEAHYTTGAYSLLVKVVVRNMTELHHFLADRLQAIPGVHATETFVVLDSPIERLLDFNKIDRRSQEPR